MLRKYRFLFLPVIFITFSSWKKHDGGSEYNIADFGAKGDGITANTKVINDVIEKCSAAGGGTVIIPTGIFVSGTIILQSNVNIQLSQGAVLKGSGDTLDYLPLKDASLFREGYTHYGLILAMSAKNISISGHGQINGNGTHFMNSIDKPHIGNDFVRKYTRQGENYMKTGAVFEDGPLSYPYRPGYMINFEHCENIHINDVYIYDSPEWTVRISDCDHAIVKAVTIENNVLIPNNDGINCSNSRNINISDCNISTGDDAIIVNGFSTQPYHEKPESVLPDKNIIGNKTDKAEYVTVSNCVLSSRSACIRIGDGEHPIRNLVFSNLVMYASNRGIGIFSRSNTQIENIIFSNIIMHTRLFSGHWWGKAEPIHISAVKDYAGGNGGKVKDIRFIDIIADAENGIIINGSASSIIENVLLERVKLNIHAGKYTNDYGGNFDLRPAYPEDSALFKHDIPGLYAQYVKNMVVSNTEINWDKNLPSFFTNGIEVDHFNGLTIENCHSSSSSNSEGLAAIKLKNGIGEILRSNFVTNGSVDLIKDK
ncbi:MAG TPA: glycosyl hydrolase family 28 protein [Puia sp.]|nr:glycosyl hydrolase family 28 protein [Puia sp.]